MPGKITPTGLAGNRFEIRRPIVVNDAPGSSKYARVMALRDFLFFV
jgi:hypothetical protein